VAFSFTYKRLHSSWLPHSPQKRVPSGLFAFMVISRDDFFYYTIYLDMQQKFNLPLSILILVLLIMCGTLIYIVMTQLRLY